MSSTSKYTVPLWLAVIINVNVIIGAGIFINAGGLAAIAGSLGALGYFCVAILFLPLVLSIAQLSRLNSVSYGGLYFYSKNQLGRYAGLFTGVCYSISQTASIAALAYAFSIYFFQYVPIDGFIEPRILSLIVLSLLCLLNAAGARIGGGVQLLFVFFKLFPIFFVLFFGLTQIRPDWFVFNWSVEPLLSSLPIAMYALIGFEMCTSIGHTIENAHENIARVLLISFMLVASICIVFQFFMFGIIGRDLASAITPFGLLEQSLVTSFAGIGARLCLVFCPFLNLAVSLSILGGCYGKIFGNIWNWYALGDTVAPKLGRLLQTKNSVETPIIALGLQWLFSGFLLYMGLNLLTIQRIAVLGVIVTYCMSIIALESMYKDQENKPSLPRFVVHLSFIPCLLIGFYCLRDLIFSLF